MSGLVYYRTFNESTQMGALESTRPLRGGGVGPLKNHLGTL